MTHLVASTTGGVAISQVERGDWDRLLSRFPDRTAFHTRGWIEVLERCYRARPILYKADAGEECVAIWPCLEIRKGPFRVLGSPLPGWGTPYMGPLFASGTDAGTILRAFASQKAFRRASYIECRVMDDSRPVNLEPLGFGRLRRFATYLLDVDCDPVQLWQRTNRSCRRGLKKADQAGIEVRCETSDAFVDDLWRMVVAVFAKSDRRPGFERGFIQSVWNQLGGSDQLLVLSAIHQGQRVGGLMFLCNDVALYGLVAAADPARLDTCPNHALFWEVILEAQRRGLRWVDFISISQFKGNFGPQAREVATHWARSRTPLDGLAKRCYEHYIRWRRGAHWRPR